MLAVLATIGLVWLTIWFMFNMVLSTIRGAKFLKSKDEGTRAAGWIVIVLSPFFHLLAILTTIGAVFAIHS